MKHGYADMEKPAREGASSILETVGLLNETLDELYKLQAELIATIGPVMGAASAATDKPQESDDTNASNLRSQILESVARCKHMADELRTAIKRIEL